MGIAIPQVITSDRATGAQVIDGSLGFSGTDQKLERTPGSAGNQQTWTWSSWVKIQPDQMNSVFSVYTGNSDRLHLRIGNSYAILAQNTGSWDFDIRSNAKFRDNEWYHFVCVADFTNSTQNDRAILYVNGERLTLGTNTLPSNTTTNTIINATKKHYIGESYSGTDFEGRMSQVYFIDGQALGPEYFGYTDGLTNTWKPKKYDTEAPTNNPNNNTTWSSNVSASSGSFGSGEEATKGFDGNTSTKCKTDTNGASITITFSGLTVQKLLRIRTNYTNGSGSDIEVNDVSYGAAATASDGEYKTISGFTGALTKIKLEAGASVNAAFSAIEVDGVILQDSTTTNNRTWDSSVTFGTNGFYLPMDGNSPIGQDQSGQGNNWTPVNFGGSVALDSPLVSGARPILNTTQGGSQAGVGVFGSKQNVGYAVTYYDDGGGNKYYIDGVKQATLTGLIRGATYTFNTVALGSTHPFRFSDSDGGSEYTNGVAAITGTATTITIPHDAPNELYYYCTQHTGMGSSITGITTNEKLADQYASNIVLALPLVGSSNDVSASIACTQTNYSITDNNNASASNDTSNFYSGSFEFDGDADYLTFTTSSDLSLDEDFTIEFWINNDTITVDTQHPSPITMPTDGSAISQIYTNSSSNFYGLYKSGDIVTTGNNSALTGVWQHVAFTRSGSTCYAFLDGVLKNTATSTATFGGTSGTFRIGSYNGSGGDVDAYMQDLRIYKGVAKYTSDFVVPSTSPNILPDTPSGVSGSSKLTKITDGGVIGDGTTSDYLQVPSSGHTDFSMDGDFTVEWFYYRQSVSNTYMWTVGDSNTSTGLELYWGSSGSTLKLYTNGSANNVGGSTRNGWSHYAVVRSGSTITVYYDGTSVGTISNSTTFSGDFTIGGEYYNGAITGGLSGPISNFRYIKGTALYTSNFTPPTAPLTNVTNTKLLCCQSVAEQQNNFIRMFKSSTLYTTKADILANATEIGDGTTLSNEYWYIVPEGTEPIDGANNQVFSTIPTFSTQTRFYWRNGSNWTQTVGGYSNTDYTTNAGTGFSYQDNDDTDSYSIYPARDFIVASQNSGSSPLVLSGAVPTRIAYYKFNGAVSPGDITANGDAAATNFNPFITDINTVRGQETGYATLNPLAKGSSLNLSNGNLTATKSASGYHSTLSTITTPTTGKWFYEVESNVSGNNLVIGIARDDFNQDAHLSSYIDKDSNGYIYRASDGYKSNNDSASSYGDSYTSGDVVGVALDLDEGTLTFYKNGVSQGVAFSSLSGRYYFGLSIAGGYEATANFGQKPFKFPPPDGFQPLNTANIRPENVIARPDQYVGVAAYTSGNGSAVSVSSYNFSPELLWFKDLDDGNNWAIFDQVRGNGLRLDCSGAGKEQDWSAYFSSFDDNGFTVTSSTSDINRSTNQICSWGWKAGGNPGISTTAFWKDDQEYASAAAAGMDGGSITPIGASVGTRQGFSIITYRANLTTGATISHGLTQKPDFAIFKNRDSTLGTDEVDWGVYHTVVGATKRLELNQNLAEEAFSGPFNDTEPTSSVFTFGGGSQGHSYLTNGPSGDRFVGYIWHNVPGLQKFGSYEGNGSSDGPFVELGFRPAVLILKCIDNFGNDYDWRLIDSTRETFNDGSGSKYVVPNKTDNQADNSPIDFLSNGFKIRSDTNEVNLNAHTFIYAAWAEAPSVDLYGGGANAR